MIAKIILIADTFMIAKENPNTDPYMITKKIQAQIHTQWLPKPSSAQIHTYLQKFSFSPGWVDEDRKLHGGIHRSRRWWLETTNFHVDSKRDVPQIAKSNKCTGCKQKGYYKLWVTRAVSFPGCVWVRHRPLSTSAGACVYTSTQAPTPVLPSESVS